MTGIGILIKRISQEINTLYMASLSASPKILRHIHHGNLSPSPKILCQLPNGICKPIPDITKSSITSYKCKFLGTLVFNHLAPSDHERQTSQSTSSSLRRLNKGSCCTPKFSLSFLKTFSHKDFQKFKFTQVQLDF